MDSAPSPASSPLAAGKKFASRYVLKRRLGLGRLGEVWLADDTRLEMDVALKFFDQSEHRAVLESVARKCMKVTHPHIVRVYDFTDDGSRCALVMEYLEGGSLARRLKERDAGCFEPAEVQDWIKQLWSGLAELHEQGLIHGNLNLANLGIAGTGELKILEAGFFEVRVATLNPEMTFSFLPCLTPQILSGKQPGQMDDSYAAGACVYELLTGKPVFLGGNLIQQIQEREATAVALRRAELGIGTQPVPEDWEQWIARSLGKSPYDRPASSEMRDQLRDAPPVSTVTAEQATASAKEAASPAARIASLSARLSRIPKQAWIGAATAAVLAVFYFTTWEPAKQALKAMETAFDELKIKTISEAEPPEALVTQWKAFQTNFEAPIAFTELDKEMIEDADKFISAEQVKADDLRRKEQAIAEKKRLDEEKKRRDEAAAIVAKVAKAKGELLTGDNVIAAENLAIIAPLLKELKEVKNNAAEVTAARLEVEKLEQEWIDIGNKQAASYASYLEKLSNTLDGLNPLLADPTKGASPKLKALTDVRGTLPVLPPTTQTGHVALLSKLDTLQKEWSEKALAEAPKVPLALKDLFAQTIYKDLSEDKLKALLEKVYSGYGIDPKEDADRTKLHQAILKQQQEAGGIVTGQLAAQDLTKAAIPVEATADELTKFAAGLIKAPVKKPSGSRKKKAPVEEPNFGERMKQKMSNLFGGSKK